MAWYYDLPYSESSGRHSLVFVNQQYDYLAGLSWSDEAGDYVLWGADDEAALIELLTYWGNVDGFSLESYLTLARTRLPELDAQRATDG